VKATSLSLRFSASSSGSLDCSLRAASKLVSRKTWLTQTSMLLVLSFAETSNDSESIFAPGTGRLPEEKVSKFLSETILVSNNGVLRKESRSKVDMTGPYRVFF
jgi:hypothetical protein